MRDTGLYWGVPGIWAIFIGFGVSSIIGGVFASSPRGVLIALGATGLFSGFLMYLVTPQRVIHASILERMHDAAVANVSLYVPHAKEQSEYTYVPHDGNEPGDGAVLLYVPDEKPQHSAGSFVYPIGDSLLAEVDDRAMNDWSGSDVELGRQIVDSLQNGLEMVGTATCTVESSEQRATVEIKRSTIDSIGQFDDPVTSFVGTAFAFGLGHPVRVKTDTGSKNEISISCLWNESVTRGGEQIPVFTHPTDP